MMVLLTIHLSVSCPEMFNFMLEMHKKSFDGQALQPTEVAHTANPQLYFGEGTLGFGRGQEDSEGMAEGEEKGREDEGAEGDNSPQHLLTNSKSAYAYH